MTTYQFPESLGGGAVHEANGEMAGVVGIELVGFTIDGSVMWLPLSLLTEIAPALPEEPPPGSVVMVPRDDEADVYHRRGDGFRKNEPWQDTNGDWCSWAQVCSYSSLPVLLVPAPTPLELPWLPLDDELKLGVGMATGCGCFGEEDGAKLVVIDLGDSSVKLPQAVAASMAAALWTAANR